MVQRVPFVQAEYDALEKTGTAVVSGQAFLRQRGGDVVTAAGANVGLNPVSSSSTQWYELNYLQQIPLSVPDSRYAEMTRWKVADADGRFRFKDVPNGRYYLATTVTWEAFTGGRYGGTATQGGQICKIIEVVDGGDLEVVLTR
jgi:hypothetical protein